MVKRQKLRTSILWKECEITLSLTILIGDRKDDYGGERGELRLLLQDERVGGVEGAQQALEDLLEKFPHEFVKGSASAKIWSLW